MPDLGPFFAFLAALVFLTAAAGLLLATLRAAQFRAEEDQFPITSDLVETADVAAL